MRGLSFLVDGEFYVADVTRVQKIARKIQITPVPTAQSAIEGIINLKGKVITVFNLCELLGREKKTNSDKAIIFKSQNEDEWLALLIDKTDALVYIDDDTIRAPVFATGAEESFCISGIAQANGKFYRMIDIDTIVEKYKEQESV
jgi:purine-binding chemotaxis protein CheW